MLEKLRKIEDAYIKLFCQKESLGSMDFFCNNSIHEMYDHNFTFIRDLTCEADLKVYITNCLSDMKKKGKDFLKIVFHPNIKLSQEFSAWADQFGFKVSKINYMLLMSPKFEMNGIDEPSCVIRQAETVDEIQMGLDCAGKFNGKRMGPELAVKKLDQKRKLYLDKSILFYICYLDGSPIGYCDWFEKEEILKFEEFVILNEYQGKGYGSRMLKKMIADAVRQGYQSLYVVTDTDGQEHNIYYKLGFDFVGEEMEIFLWNNKSVI